MRVYIYIVFIYIYIYIYVRVSDPTRPRSRRAEKRAMDGTPRITMVTAVAAAAARWQDEQPYVGNGNCLPPLLPGLPPPRRPTRLINYTRAQHDV